MTIQCAVILKNSRVATEFTDFIIKHVSGFHLRTDGRDFIVVDTPTPIEPVPQNLQFVLPLSGWAEYGLAIDQSKRLARVAVRDDTVVWNVSHGVFDGVSFSLLAHWFQKQNPRPATVFPYASDIELADEVRQATNIEDHVHALDDCTRIKWSHPPINFPEFTRNDSFEISFPYASLQCYDRKTDKFIGLTDHLWRSAIVVGHAFTPEQFSYSCCTWVNLRPFMKRWGIGATVASVTVGAPDANPEWTLAELEAAVRRGFNQRMKEKEYLLDMAAQGKSIPRRPLESAFFDVSNAGYYPMGDPFVDMFLQQSVPANHCTKALPFGAATNFQGERRRQFFRYPYSQAVFARKDAEKVFKGLMHSLQHFRPNLKVKDAIKELRELFNSLE